MADLDKVIREIKLCTSGGYPCENCSHYGHGEDLVGCMDELLSDALELLKEQEAKIEQLKRYINGFSKDAVPVVRCKNCKHWDSKKNECHNINSYMQYRPCFNDWFCADGERR